MRFEDRVGFLRGGARPPIATLVRFIDEHRHDIIDGRAFGVEPICRVLSEHGCYAAKGRPTCDRVIRDAELLAQIRRVHADNYGCMGPARCGFSCTGNGLWWPAAPWNG
jgi:hypothetical protein